jgi:ABC-type transporter Mla MlaB component
VERVSGTKCVLPLAAQPELSLDLSDLRRVDDAGVEALRRLKKRDARITHCPRMIPN